MSRVFPVEEKILPSSTESSSSIGTTIDSFPGMKFRINWLCSCVSELSNSVPDFGDLNDSEKEKLIIQRFLLSDMKLSCAGVLPENATSLHLVNKIDNITCHSLDTFKDIPAGPKRILMLSMTDGVQCVFGVEHRPIEDLKVLAPAGLKVVIRNVMVRSGRLLLVPGCLKVLGGMVEDLEAERKKLVEEFNNKRGRPLFDQMNNRATLAAWKTKGKPKVLMVPFPLTIQLCRM
ncbi:hypothetical protein MKX03_004537 [Papaver bracteatum]|nr:hypothetical protein MKX03_004537 [Papaver bracteatum]